MLTRMGLMKKIQYISTVSGGGWFAAPYTFKDIGLGSYKKPEELTMLSLETDNFDNPMFFW